MLILFDLKSSGVYKRQYVKFHLKKFINFALTTFLFSFQVYLVKLPAA